MIVGPKSGTSGMYSRMSSSRRSLPSSARSTTAMAVNCLETDATWNVEAGVIGMSYSRFAIP